MSASAVVAAPNIQIVSPLDQTFVNPGGGAPAPVEITYQVTGNTCTGVKSSFGIVPYVNGNPVACAGTGCSCDGTTESCNNVTKTITIDGADFSGCLNTIRIEMSPRPFCSPLCLSPCSTAILSATVHVWQSPYRQCTGPADCNRAMVGRPIDVATGKMYYEVTDLVIRGPLPVELTRRYDSLSSFSGALGFGWQHAYLMRLEDAGTNQKVFVDRQGRRIYFAKNTQGTWEENRIDHLALIEPGTPAFRITDNHQTKYEFDANGVLTRIADRNNNQLTFSYTGADLSSITDGFGRSVTLAYSGGRLSNLSAGGRTVSYTYTGDNLTRVDYPDGSFFTYEYTDPGDPHNLTAVRDALGHLVEGHSYDGSDRVVHSQSEGGVGALDIVYDSPTQTTVTNSRGVPSVYTHDSFSGLVTASNGPGCASCGTGGASTTLTYDRFLNLTERIDGRGIHTQMPSYDAKGNVLTRIEAVGTPLQRTTTFTYHPTFNFVATTTVPSVGTCGALNKVATNTYDPNTGDLMQRQVTGCNDTAPFTYTTAFTYDAHGQLRTTDGPRNPSDVSDITTNDYYPDADPDPALRGRLMRRTDALGHQVTHAGYDLFGNVGSVTDGNAVVTTFIYDSRDRLLERRIHGASAAEDIVTINT